MLPQDAVKDCAEHPSQNRIEVSKKFLKKAHAEMRVFEEDRLSKRNGCPFLGLHPVPLVDLQATDQVAMNGKARFQLGCPTGEVASAAASHEVALLAGAALVPNTSVVYRYLEVASSCQPRI